MLNEAYAGTLVAMKDRIPTRSLYDCFDLYVAWCKQNRPRTHRDRQHLVRMLKKHIPDMPISDVSQIAIERFKRARGTLRTSKPATINRSRRDVEALRWPRGCRGVDLGEAGGQVCTSRDAAQGTTWPCAVFGRRRDAKALLAALRPDVREVVVTALLTGMRRGEILNMKKSANPTSAGV